ncbi:ADP-ribose pyrophosphatase, partial [Vibrio owensii]
EVIEVVTLSRVELEQQIIQGIITDAITIACLSKARLCGYI